MATLPGLTNLQNSLPKLSERVSDVSHRVSDRVSDVSHRVSDRVSDVSHRVSSRVSHAMDGNTADRRRERRELRTQGRTPYVNVGRVERALSVMLGGLLTTYALRKRGPRGAGAAVAGAFALYRGLSGNCTAYSAMGINTADEAAMGEVAEVDHDKSIDVRHSIEVARPAQELYDVWRDFSNLPHFMPHLQRVDVLSDSKSHWVTKGPIGTTVEWDAEIVDERPGEWIAWQSVEPAQVPNNGTVLFRETGDDTTEIFVTLEAQPPAGRLGDLVARMFGRSPDRQVRVALDRFKEMAESGFAWNEGDEGAGDDESGADDQQTADREVAVSGARAGGRGAATGRTGRTTRGKRADRSASDAAGDDTDIDSANDRTDRGDAGDAFRASTSGNGTGTDRNDQSTSAL